MSILQGNVDVLTQDQIKFEGWYLSPQWMDFTTSVSGSLYNCDKNQVDLGFSTISFYDQNDVVLVDQESIAASCVKTVVDWQPTFDYAMLEIHFHQETAPTASVRVWAIGAPSSVNLALNNGGADISLFDIETVVASVKQNPTVARYVNGLDTNKLRFIFRHDVNFQHHIGLRMIMMRN